MPPVVSSLEAARVDNAILLDYLTSKVALGKPESRSTEPKIPIHNNCMNEELQFGMPGCSGDYNNEGDETDERDAIPIAGRQRPPVTQLEGFDLGTSDVGRYEGEDGDDADVDPDDEEEASQADDGSMHNVED